MPELRVAVFIFQGLQGRSNERLYEFFVAGPVPEFGNYHRIESGCGGCAIIPGAGIVVERSQRASVDFMHHLARLLIAPIIHPPALPLWQLLQRTPKQIMIEE